MVESVDDFVWGVRRMEVYANGNLERIAISVAGIKDDGCDGRLLLFSM